MSVKLDNAHWQTSKSHFRYPFKQRVTSKDIKELILNKEDQITRNGYIYEMSKKNLGHGVWEIWFEKEKYSKESI